MTWHKNIVGVSTSLFLLSTFTVGLPAQAFTPNWQQGASIQSRYQGDFGSADFRASMDRLIESGVNHVSLVAPHFQNGPNASDIYAGVNTPDDDALISGIRYLKSQGVEVSIKLFMESGQGWRAEIRPNDKATWFANYTNIATKYGQIAQAEGVAMIVLGTEMVGVASAAQDPANTQYWRDLIASVRGVYSGALTYGGNWGGAYNEKEEIEFWDDLDYIGVSAYYEPGRYVDGNNVEALKGYWAGIDQNELAPLSARFNKPIIFTEVGYRNISGTTVDPWNFSRSGEPNEGEQRVAYQALFEYFNNSDYLAGIHLWDWSSDPNACGSNNFDYTYCGKLAEDVVKRYYSGTGGTIPTTLEEIPVVEEVVEETTEELPVDDSEVVAGETETEEEIVEEVQETEEVVEEALEETTEEVVSEETVIEIDEVDAAIEGAVEEVVEADPEEVQEIIDNASQEVTEEVTSEVVEELPLDDSNMTGAPTPIAQDDSTESNDSDENEDSSDTNANTADEPESEVIPVTIFKDPLVTNEVVEVEVEMDKEDGTLVANDSESKNAGMLDIWWVTDSETVDGEQPFKAMVEGYELDEYTMYWQVDGDQLNEMGDSLEDYPHKESMVDLTNWNWDEQGEYEITFIAKNNDGEIISQKSVTIFVVN